MNKDKHIYTHTQPHTLTQTNTHTHTLSHDHVMDYALSHELTSASNYVDFTKLLYYSLI